MIKLYTSPTCGSCPAVKKKLDDAGVEYTLRDVSLPEARDELFELGVRAVPYLYAVNASGSELKALGNSFSVNSLQEFMNG